MGIMFRITFTEQYEGYAITYIFNIDNITLNIISKYNLIKEYKDNVDIRPI